MRKSFFTQAIIILFIALALPACLTPRKMDKWVGRHYAQTVQTKMKKSDYISFRVDSPLPDNKVSESQKTKRKVLPALFYWQWTIQNSSTLNVMLPMNIFTSSFVDQANSKKLREKLNGGSIEITLRSNPADFTLNDNGWLVFVLVYYISKERIYVEPAKPDFTIDYKITTASGQTKDGSISVANPNKEKAPRFFQSLKAAIAEYLNLSDVHIKQMAKDMADKLAAELSE